MFLIVNDYLDLSYDKVWQISINVWHKDRLTVTLKKILVLSVSCNFGDHETETKFMQNQGGYYHPHRARIADGELDKRVNHKYPYFWVLVLYVCSGRFCLKGIASVCQARTRGQEGKEGAREGGVNDESLMLKRSKIIEALCVLGQAHAICYDRYPFSSSKWKIVPSHYTSSIIFSKFSIHKTEQTNHANVLVETKIVIVGIYVHPNTISTAYIYETIEAPTVNRYTYTYMHM